MTGGPRTRRQSAQINRGGWMERARALAAKGASKAAIRRDLLSRGAGYSTANATAHMVTNKNYKKKVVKITLSQRNFTKLKSAASARETMADDLADKILSLVLENNLIDAVLDDGVAP